MYTVYCNNCQKRTRVTEEEMQRSRITLCMMRGDKGYCAFCYVGEVTIKVSAKKE